MFESPIKGESVDTMSQLFVDEDKCLRDGLCATICPLGIIEHSGNGDLPRLAEASGNWCIGCGHCVAVCPIGALSHSRMAVDTCLLARKSWIPDPDQLEHVLRMRRSIRRFKKKTPDRKVLERLIAMAGHAPSGHNRQPVEWMVFNSREDVRRLAGLTVDWMRYLLKRDGASSRKFLFRMVIQAWEDGNDTVLHHAPSLVVAHSAAKTGTETIDAAVTLAYMDLAALSMGLGCCWAGLFMMAAALWEPIGELLQLPDGHSLHGAMLVGYPKYEFKRLPLRRKPVVRWR